MHLHYECLICQMKSQMKRMDKIGDNDRCISYFNEVCGILSGADRRYAVSSVFHELEELNQRYGLPRRDFEPMKRHFNDLMLSLLPRLRERVDRAPDPLAEALKICRAGNYIDFGAFDKVDEGHLMERIDRVRAETLGDEYGFLLKDLEKGKTLCYLVDNCGEVVLDMLVLQVIGEKFPHIRLHALVRGEPVLNDVTMEDALYVGLDKYAILSHNGSNLAGNQLELISPEARKLVEESDLVIAKGMGNFETICHCGLNIYYLFLCKCDFFARRLGVPLMTGVMVNERRMQLQERGGRA